MAMKKNNEWKSDIEEAVKKAGGLSVQFGFTKNGHQVAHIMIRHGFVRKMFFAGTPSDGHAYMNAVSQARRIVREGLKE